MKKLYAVLASLFLVLTLPFPVLADEATSTDGTASSTDQTTAPTDQGTTSTTTDSQTNTASDSSQTPSPAPLSTIHVHVNVRYKDTVVYSGLVALTTGSMETVSDDKGSPRQLKADSAMAALVEGSHTSLYTISDLMYYDSFGALYVRCINIPSITNACDNWQYVVDDTYPPVGADSYALSDNDTVYFYFGSPRRLTTSSNVTDRKTPVTVKAESYDYSNDSWKPIANTGIGATQPNPSDPYSPTVIKTVTTGNDGSASLLIGETGSYGLGLALDYYSTSENLSVIESLGARQSDGGASGSTLAQSLGAINQAPALPVASTTLQAPVVTTDPDKMIISLDISISDFKKKYEIALESAKAVQRERAREAEVSPKDNQNLANVSTAIDSIVKIASSTEASGKKGWLKGLLKAFGI